MTATITHAMTQPQPLAWALASGHCPVICSDTRPDMARIGELIGIHASTGVGRDALGDYLSALAAVAGQGVDARVVPDMKRLVRGALVGVARLTGVLRVRDGLYRVMRGNAVDVTLVDQSLVARLRPWWRPGTKWGLLLDEVVALSEPIPMRGAGGLWRIQTPDGWFYDGPPGARGNGAPYYTVATEWALEQWRKGRAR